MEFKTSETSLMAFSQKHILEKFKNVHGDKYDYSKVNYIRARTKVEIICPKHRSFFQRPDIHYNGSGCPKCARDKLKTTCRYSQDIIIKKFKKIHGDKYNYSKINFKNTNTRIEIICSKHGSFFAFPSNHLKGSGCKLCSLKNLDLTTQEAIKKYKKIHGDKYNYSRVNYKGNYSKVEIICPKHGSFLQVHNNHINGNGCPKCKSSKGETIILVWLKENNIEYIPQYKFSKCRNIHLLPFDFYLPDLNILIEYDGRQHFSGNYDFFGGVDEFLKIKFRDKIKTDFAKKENIKLIRIPYTKIKNIPQILIKELQ